GWQRRSAYRKRWHACGEYYPPGAIRCPPIPIRSRRNDRGNGGYARSAQRSPDLMIVRLKGAEKQRAPFRNIRKPIGFKASREVIILGECGQEESRATLYGVFDGS